MFVLLQFVSEVGSPFVVLIILQLAMWIRLVWNYSPTHLSLSRVFATTTSLQGVFVEVDLILLFNEG